MVDESALEKYYAGVIFVGVTLSTRFGVSNVVVGSVDGLSKTAGKNLGHEITLYLPNNLP